ncbi:MAG TPA: TonB-dependent receptor [Flavobacterium sp.]|nr:TonB-dependent receptor [Flavobacterium sp.]
MKLLFRLSMFVFCLFLTSHAIAQEHKISGKITEANGMALPGVSITLGGSLKGTTTDVDGSFIIEGVKAGNYELTASYIGFKSKSISFEVPQKSLLKVILEEDQSELDEVIVTGVFDPRSKMKSSVAISTVNAKELVKLAPVSAADLIKNVPGVYVNSSSGETRNTVYARGISANSNSSISTANNGYYYVSLQEDGLPVTAISDGDLTSDLFFRNDATTKRLEGVRGGTASITSVNAPGGIFNFLSKDGSEGMNSVSVKSGLEGNGKNPFFRTDLSYGSKINDKLFYNIGGFYRNADGAKYPGYPLNKGGQITGNITKQYGEGSSIRVFAKYLNDRNGQNMVTMAQGFDEITLAPGVNINDSYLLPAGSVAVPDGRGGTFNFDPKKLTTAKDFSIGFNLNHKLKNNWTIGNNFKYSDKNVNAQTNSATSFTGLTDGSTYYFSGGVGGPGSVNLPGVYTFTNMQTNQVVAQVEQSPISPYEFGYKVLNSNVPAGNTSLLYSGSNYLNSSLNEIMNQFNVGKKWDKISVNAGVFYSKSKIDETAMQAPTLSLSLIQDKPMPLDVSFAAVTGQTFQMNDPQGYMKLGGSFGYSDFDADISQLAFFLGNNISMLDDKLNFDWGFRLETSNITGVVDKSVPNFPRSAGGGLDGNILTVYDNFSQDLGGSINKFDKNISGFSISGGLNYSFNAENSVYIRYSRGEKAPDLRFYRAYTDQITIDNIDPVNQVVTQLEAAYKFKGQKLKAEITPFISTLENVSSTTMATDLNNQFYFTPTLFNSVQTVGVELELNWDILNNVSLTGGATFQKAELKDWKVWNTKGNGQADDVLIDYSGNEAENNPNVILRLTPSFHTNRFYALLNCSYLGERQANIPNAYSIPGFAQLDLGVGYDVTSRLKVALNVNNLTNTFGIMTSLPPGDIVQVFNPNNVTQDVIAANPNAVHPVLAIQQRAYFLTFTYKL